MSARLRVDAAGAVAGAPAPDQMGATGTVLNVFIRYTENYRGTYFDLSNRVKIVTLYEKLLQQP